MSYGEASCTRLYRFVQRWFQRQIGQPTDIPAASSPRIANDERLIITAPAKSVKNPTAFL